jgi:hypothetical protein
MDMDGDMPGTAGDGPAAGGAVTTPAGPDGADRGQGGCVSGSDGAH